MLLLLPLVALLAVGVLLALGVLGRERTTRPSLGYLVAAGGVVAIAVMVAGVGGLREQRADSRADRPAAADRPTTATPPAPSFPTVSVDVQDPDQIGEHRVVDGLPAAGVVVVRAAGFETFERGRVELCSNPAGRGRVCRDRFPVQFDEDGRAEFQYLLRAGAVPGGCRAAQATCLLKVTGDDSDRTGTVLLLLVDRYRPAKVSVTPDAGLRAGQVVEIAVSGLAPGARASARFCAPPGVVDASRCTVPGTGGTFTAGPDGSGVTVLQVPAGAAGVCGPRRACAVTVLSGNGFLAAAPVPVRYSLGPGPSYDRGRLVGGMLAALALLVVAVGLLRTTDWVRPTEAATPEMDVADLQTDLNLDELFGTDDELEAAFPAGGGG